MLLVAGFALFVALYHLVNRETKVQSFKRALFGLLLRGRKDRERPSKTGVGNQRSR